MLRLVPALFSLLLPVWLLACAHGTAAKSAPSANEHQPVSPSVFLWHATQPGKPGEVWLLGSVHMRASDKATLDQAIVEQVQKCERAAFELDFDAIDMAEMTTYMQREGSLPDGKKLKDVVEPETWKQVQKLLARLKLGEAMIERLRPWTASLVLQLAYYEQRGMGGEQGVDRAVQTFARREPSKKREIIGLETALEQLEALRGSMAQSQEAMLLSTAEDIDSGESEEVLSLYEKGDERGLEAMIVGSRSESPELEPFMREVLDVRNERMAKKLLPDFDKPGCTFATVGAAHLFGPTGLRTLFEKAGADVVSVPGKGPAAADLQALTVPESVPYVSEEDGFRVELGGRVARQEMPIPGGGQARVFMVQNGTKSVSSITIMDVPPHVGPELRVSLLEQALRGGLQNSQVETGEPTEVTLGGEKALRMQGVGAANGAIGKAFSAGVVHGDKLVIVLVMAITRDEKTFAEVEATFENVLRTFAWLPPKG